MDSFYSPEHGVRGSTPHLSLHHGCVCVSFGSCTTFARKFSANRRTPEKRGNVERFTPASRRRLRRTLAQIQLPALPAPRFITLTYHNSWEGRHHSKDLANWLRTIKNRFGDLHYIWRCELQKRGAPHFHIMLWQQTGDAANDAEYIRSLRMIWAHVSEQGTAEHRKYGFHSRTITRGLGALMAYLRKYLAKEDDPASDHPYKGRRWAASRGLPTAPYLRLDLPHSAAVDLRRFARKLLKSRFRHVPHRKRRVSFLADAEHLTLYIGWDVIARYLYSLDVTLHTEPGDTPLPWHDPLL